MADEHRCHAPEGHRLCVNNCGLSGSPATMDLCSKCYQDFRLNGQLDSGAAAVKSSVAAAPPLFSPEYVSVPVQEAALALPEAAADAMAVAACSHQPNRCSVCRRRVGLTGFRCRCGITFCGTHRYPEKHGCGFDFKRLGREEIARANPVVKAEKLRKI